ncbi:MAG: hypothetical protein AAGI03_04465 [Pseudomonadota bacterium]
MTVAKYTVFELIRAIRRLGTVGLFIMGLLAGSTLIAAFSESGETSYTTSNRFSADAAEPFRPSVFAAPSQPWSRVMGGGGFEKITDVAVTQRNELVFAGLKLGVNEGENSRAILVRTDPHGFVNAQSGIDHPDVGSVSRVILDDLGAARLVHWVNTRPAFARTDPEGNILWSRVYDVFGNSVWADVRPADDGHSIVALTDGDPESTQLRMVRFDHAGKVLWRSELAKEASIDTVRMVDSGDGGALVALETSTLTGVRTVSIVRLDRRGRTAWKRDVLSGDDIRLADAALDSQGGVILLAGTPSALVRFDGLGQLNWMRDLPALSPSGRHVIAAMDNGLVQVMAEPNTAGIGRRHWLARFDADGREVWSQTRANRSNATLEAVRMASNGAIIAGGSMVSSADGDTDMLMMAVAVDGTFPQGFGTIPSQIDQGAFAFADSESDEPSIVAASMVVDGSVALEAAYAADSAAIKSASEPDQIRIAPSYTEAILPAIDVASTPSDAGSYLTEQDRPQVREVSARLDASALAVPAAASFKPDARSSSSPPAAADDIEALARPTSGVDEPKVGVISETESADVATPRAVAPRQATQAAWSPREERPAYAYQCTFTCLADSEDMVKYPVTRIIANVAEDNSNLVSLDVMAMDRGICLATGGRVFDAPRLPPVCDRVN